MPCSTAQAFVGLKCIRHLMKVLFNKNILTVYFYKLQQVENHCRTCFKKAYSEAFDCLMFLLFKFLPFHTTPWRGTEEILKIL